MMVKTNVYLLTIKTITRVARAVLLLLLCVLYCAVSCVCLLWGAAWCSQCNA